MPQFRFHVQRSSGSPLLAALQLALGAVVLIALATFAGFVFLGIVVVGIPAAILFVWWLRLKATWREYRYQQGLKSSGRTISVSEIEPELSAGRGTLIFELHAGRTRVWWTSEDALGPEAAALPTRLPVGAALFGMRSQSDEEVMLARQIGEWYLDEQSGRAKLLADLPAETLADIENRFPKMQMVTLVTDFAPPLIALGSPQETTSPPEAETSERRSDAESRRLPSA